MKITVRTVDGITDEYEADDGEPVPAGVSYSHRHAVMNERNDLYVMLVYYRAAEPDDSRLVTPGPRVEAFYPAGGWVRVEPAPDVGIIEPPEVRSPTRER